MTYMEFDDVDEMFKKMRRQEKQALSNLHPKQKEVVWGSYWLRPVVEIPCVVYGYVSTPDELRESEREAGADEQEIEWSLESITESYERGYRYGRCYSIIVPDGEWGSTHISHMWPITREEYELAESKEWNLDKEDFLTIVRRVLVGEDDE